MKVTILIAGIATIVFAGGWFWAPSQAVTTQVQIDASPDEVWAVFADFETYESWNPFLPAIAGEMNVGERLSVTFNSQTFGNMEIAPIVVAVDPAREFRWKGMLLVPGLFDGEHFFELEAVNGGTRFTHGEKFAGFLLWFFDLDVMRADFDTMNSSLAMEVSRRG